MVEGGSGRGAERIAAVDRTSGGHALDLSIGLARKSATVRAGDTALAIVD
jgi:hypothetical protein